MGWRQRRRLKNVLVLMTVLAAFFGLSVMGMAFAYWADEVVIEGEVTVGNLIVGIYDYASWDPGPNYLEPGGALYPLNPPTDGTVDNRILIPARSAVWQNVLPTGAAVVLPSVFPRPEPTYVTGGNVASTHSSNIEPLLFTVPEVMGATSLPFYDRVREEFNNVYQSYVTGTTLVVANNGTLPVDVEGLDVVTVEDLDGVLPYTYVEHWDAFLWEGDLVVGGWGEVFEPAAMPLLEEFLLEWMYDEAVQLEPGRVLEIGIAVCFDPMSAALEFPMGANLSLEMEVRASLWNQDY